MTPAEHVIKKCGGIAATAEITGRTTSVVHRWTYTVEKGGTGGFIPRKAQEKILEAAVEGKVDVQLEDFFQVPASALQDKPCGPAETSE